NEGREHEKEQHGDVVGLGWRCVSVGFLSPGQPGRPGQDRPHQNGKSLKRTVFHVQKTPPLGERKDYPAPNSGCQGQKIEVANHKGPGRFGLPSMKFSKSLSYKLL